MIQSWRISLWCLIMVPETLLLWTCLRLILWLTTISLHQTVSNYCLQTKMVSTNCRYTVQCLQFLLNFHVFIGLLLSIGNFPITDHWALGAVTDCDCISVLDLFHQHKWLVMLPIVINNTLAETITEYLDLGLPACMCWKELFSFLVFKKKRRECHCFFQWQYNFSFIFQIFKVFFPKFQIYLSSTFQWDRQLTKLTTFRKNKTKRSIDAITDVKGWRRLKLQSFIPIFYWS